MIAGIVATAYLLPLSAQAASPKAELVSVDMIWDEAPHCAFTDLIRWRDKWICGFREGQDHVGSHGTIRLLQSADGTTWTSLAKLEHETYDLRDANLSVTPDDRLMVVAGSQVDQGNGRRSGSLAYFSPNGVAWSEPATISELGRWLWGVTWHDGIAWGVAYKAPDGGAASTLLKSADGVHFNTVAAEFETSSPWPTEARVHFGADDQAVCLHRCDAKRNFASVGVASAPYTDWTWHELDRFIGGPNLLQLPGGTWIAAGRITNPEPVTALLHLDPEAGTATPILTLPSGGDTSYPGLAWHDGMLWMSYYSSHEDSTKVYLAKIKIDEAK